jgi:hypothetical protein
VGRAPPPGGPSLRVHLAVHAPEHEDAAESAPRGEREEKEEEEGRKGRRGDAASADVGLDALASEVQQPAVQVQGRPLSASACNTSARHQTRFSKVLCKMALHSKCTRALTCENFVTDSQAVDDSALCRPPRVAQEAASPPRAWGGHWGQSLCPQWLMCL